MLGQTGWISKVAIFAEGQKCHTSSLQQTAGSQHHDSAELPKEDTGTKKEKYDSLLSKKV
jgi:hypothetical protein